MARRTIEQVIAMFSGGANLDYRTRTVELLRSDLEFLMKSLPPERDAQRTPCQVAGLAGHWFEPAAYQTRRTVLYLHGGGYVVGTTATYADLLGRIAMAAEARVLGFDYRLAPEHPYPAAVDDGVRAYEHLLARGHTPAEIAFVGDSAGGGLTLAVLQRLRDTGVPLPAAAALISPWTDLSLSSPRVAEDEARDPVILRIILERFAKLYLGDRDLKDTGGSPLFADLSGLPPLLIQVGTREILFDDSQRLADAARERGVEVQLNVWDGMIHVWHLYAGILVEGAAAINELGAFLRQRIAG